MIAKGMVEWEILSILENQIQEVGYDWSAEKKSRCGLRCLVLFLSGSTCVITWDVCSSLVPLALFLW